MIQTFDDYQQAAARTAIYPEDARVTYPALGLAGEAGEVANKIKKIIRDDGMVVTDERRAQISKEIGGVMWYVAALCTDLELNLGDVCRENIAILNSRQERGTLQGDGDER
jgi:NTP pyrophosphatase (non-canonical NTP hydrolase)